MKFVALLLTLFGCVSDLNPVSGTTVRTAESQTKGEKSEQLGLYIFSGEEDCYAEIGDDAERKACLPFVDRASGTVRVAFQMRVDGSPWPVPLSDQSITILHNKQQLSSAGARKVTIIPHEPVATKQLFILLIDGSGSMAIVDGNDGKSRMDKLKAALRRNDVVDAFFPKEVQTAVAPLVFQGADVAPIGGKWIVENPRDYKEAIKSLEVGKGYTFLYQSVLTTSTTVLEREEIKQAIGNRQLAPTLIALTDGFNNQAPDDLCEANADRLQRTLQSLQQLRLGASADIRYTPTIYTVGLGRKAWPNFIRPDGIEVKPRDICGKQAKRLINGDVENRGVDNAALDWIAHVGGGESFVRRDTDGLAEAFVAAAAKRYKWFEARYRVDPFYLRRSFETTLKLTSLIQTEASMRIYPSGWLDGPPGKLGENNWVEPTPFTRTATFVLPVLAIIIALNYLPAAFFNVRRALFSRVARRKR